jgi:hypothetical protein
MAQACAAPSTPVGNRPAPPDTNHAEILGKKVNEEILLFTYEYQTWHNDQKYGQ